MEQNKVKEDAQDIINEIMVNTNDWYYHFYPNLCLEGAY